MDIQGVLAKHARYRPEHLAVVFDDQRLTYGEFDRRVNRVANALGDLGIVKNDKAATFLTNSLELLEVYWAAAKIGAVVVPLSSLLRGRGLATLLRDADVRVIVTESAHATFLDEVRSELSISPDRYLLTDGNGTASGYRDYSSLAARASDAEPGGSASGS